MESWEKDLENYPEHFREIVRASLGESPEPDRQEEPEPVELVPSGIRVLPAEEQIKEYLEFITPSDAHSHTFKFESFLLGISVAAVVLGIIAVLVTLIGG
jgi:hypothetical protein